MKQHSRRLGYHKNYSPKYGSVIDFEDAASKSMKMTKKNFCRSQPRLLTSVYSESRSLSSRIGLTGNMQLSNKYKSSADLVSELLKQPFCLPDLEKTLQKDMIMSQDTGNQIKISEIKSTSKMLTKFDIKSDKNIAKSDTVTTQSLKSFINEKDGQNMHIQKEHTPKFLCYQYTKNPPAYFPQRMPSGFPSFTSSIGDTEDLYCDDELDPNLENDPNMRLYTENINNTDADFFNLGDEVSILSMEVPSTGHHSLVSTASYILDNERKQGLGSA